MRTCLTLAHASADNLQSAISRYAGLADLIEVRFDLMQEIRFPQLPKDCATEFVATCRPEREGGTFRGSETRRLELLTAAAQHGFHWLDVEHDVSDWQPPPGPRLIRSLHLFDSMPEDFPRRLESLMTLPGDVFKAAVTVTGTAELTSLLRLMAGIPPTVPRVVIGMGQFGQPSRYLGAYLGNAWTYVSEPASKPAAAGQFSLDEARTCLKGFASQDFRLYGVLGTPLRHSLSPQVHNALFRQHGIAAAYLRLELDSLRPWFDFLDHSSLPFQGFSVTLPFKSQVLAFLAEEPLHETSVNTLRRTTAGWSGINTDRAGFLLPLLRRQPSLSGLKAVVIGCGGVAQTVVSALQGQGVAVTVAGRNAVKLRRFSDSFRCPWSLLTKLPATTDLLVNTTPVGQYPETGAVPVVPDSIHTSIAYDLVYNPEKTRFLEEFRAQGATPISGIEMFAEQARGQFEYWTGEAVSIEEVLAVVRQASQTPTVS